MLKIQVQCSGTEKEQKIWDAETFATLVFPALSLEGCPSFLNVNRFLLAHGDSKKDGIERSKFLWNRLFDMRMLWELSNANFDLVPLF